MAEDPQTVIYASFINEEIANGNLTTTFTGEFRYASPAERAARLSSPPVPVRTGMDDHDDEIQAQLEASKPVTFTAALLACRSPPPQEALCFQAKNVSFDLSGDSPDSGSHRLHFFGELPVDESIQISPFERGHSFKRVRFADEETQENSEDVSEHDVNSSADDDGSWQTDIEDTLSVEGPSDNERAEDVDDLEDASSLDDANSLEQTNETIESPHTDEAQGPHQLDGADDAGHSYTEEDRSVHNGISLAKDNAADEVAINPFPESPASQEPMDVTLVESPMIGLGSGNDLTIVKADQSANEEQPCTDRNVSSADTPGPQELKQDTEIPMENEGKNPATHDQSVMIIEPAQEEELDDEQSSDEKDCDAQPVAPSAAVEPPLNSWIATEEDETSFEPVLSRRQRKALKKKLAAQKKRESVSAPVDRTTRVASDALPVAAPAAPVQVGNDPMPTPAPAAPTDVEPIPVEAPPSTNPITPAAQKPPVPSSEPVVSDFARPPQPKSWKGRGQAFAPPPNWEGPPRYSGTGPLVSDMIPDDVFREDESTRQKGPRWSAPRRSLGISGTSQQALASSSSSTPAPKTRKQRPAPLDLAKYMRPVSSPVPQTQSSKSRECQRTATSGPMVVESGITIASESSLAPSSTFGPTASSFATPPSVIRLPADAQKAARQSSPDSGTGWTSTSSDASIHNPNRAPSVIRLLAEAQKAARRSTSTPDSGTGWTTASSDASIHNPNRAAWLRAQEEMGVKNSQSEAQSAPATPPRAAAPSLSPSPAKEPDVSECEFADLVFWAQRVQLVCDIPWKRINGFNITAGENPKEVVAVLQNIHLNDTSSVLYEKLRHVNTTMLCMYADVKVTRRPLTTVPFTQAIRNLSYVSAIWTMRLDGDVLVRDVRCPQEDYFVDRIMRADPKDVARAIASLFTAPREIGFLSWSQEEDLKRKAIRVLCRLFSHFGTLFPQSIPSKSLEIPKPTEVAFPILMGLHVMLTMVKIKDWKSLPVDAHPLPPHWERTPRSGRHKTVNSLILWGDEREKVTVDRRIWSSPPSPRLASLPQPETPCPMRSNPVARKAAFDAFLKVRRPVAYEAVDKP